MPKGPSSSPEELIAHIDGASRGNPGLAAYGVVLETGEGKRVAELKNALGEATNNVAEYQALLAALGYALDHRHRRLQVKSDSELLTRQIQGRYKVKSPALRPLYDRAREMIGRLEAFSIHHVPRAENRDADRLANLALDGGAVAATPSPGARSPSRPPLGAHTLRLKSRP